MEFFWCGVQIFSVDLTLEKMLHGKEETVETKSIDSQILQELQQIKILLKQLVEKIS